MAKTGEMDKVEKVVEEAVQRALSASEPSTVGRTPWDALTEITGSVLKLLGQWTLPILFIGLIAVGWYFQQEQNQRKSAQYEADLKTLRAERDVAYQRISEFNEEIANVSGQQIKNLTDAFDSLKRINEESVGQQQNAFALERQAEDAAEALEDAEEELRVARTEILDGQKKLGENQKRLEKSQQELQKRVDEVERKEADLSVRGGRIGELQDQLRALQESADTYVRLLEIEQTTWDDTVFELQSELKLLDQKVADLQGEEVVLRAPVFWEQDRQLDDAQAAYALAAAAVRDMTVDLGAVLTPMVQFDGWGLDRGYADTLVGLSVGRLEELLVAEDGFGFDFWRLVRADTDEEAYVGFVAEPPRLRNVILFLSEEGSQEKRVTETYTYDGLLPKVGILDDAFELGLVSIAIERDGVSIDRPRWRGGLIDGMVSLDEIFGVDLAVADFAIGGEADVPQLDPDAFRALLASRELPLGAERGLQDGTGNLSALFVATENLQNGYDGWKPALDVIIVPELKTLLLDQIERGIARSLDLARNPRAAPRRRNTDILDEALGRLVALALQPDFALYVTDTEICENLVKKSVDPEDVDAECWPVADIRVEAAGEFTLDLKFEDKTNSGDWRYVEGLF